MKLLILLLLALPLAAQTIWPDNVTPAVVDVGPGNPVELGVKFRPDVAGTITGIRFYKSAANTGPHTVTLWTAGGTPLASANSAAEGPTTWIQIDFPSPVPITAGTTYVASYRAGYSHFAFTPNAMPLDASPLHAINSVYSYTGGFPNLNYLNSNYWVDVVFQPAGTAPPIPTGLTLITGPAAVVSTPCPLGWTGGKQADGTCLAVKQ